MCRQLLARLVLELLQEQQRPGQASVLQRQLLVLVSAVPRVSGLRQQRQERPLASPTAVPPSSTATTLLEPRSEWRLPPGASPLSLERQRPLEPELVGLVVVAVGLERRRRRVGPLPRRQLCSLRPSVRLGRSPVEASRCLAPVSVGERRLRRGFCWNLGEGASRVLPLLVSEVRRPMEERPGTLSERPGQRQLEFWLLRLGASVLLSSSVVRSLRLQRGSGH